MRALEWTREINSKDKYTKFLQLTIPLNGAKWDEWESTNVTRMEGTRGRENRASSSSGRNRRSLNFRFRSTPPIFGHHPRIWVRGRRSMGRSSRSKCYYQNCHPTTSRWKMNRSSFWRGRWKWAVESWKIENFAKRNSLIWSRKVIENIARIANAVPFTLNSRVTMNDEIVVLNCQKCNQCLTYHKYLG